MTNIQRFVDDVTKLANEFELEVNVTRNRPMTITITDPNISLEETPEGQNFKLLASRYGLKPEDLGKTFWVRRTRYKIVGLKPSRPAYPIDAIRVNDQARFKFPADGVAEALG